MRLVPALLALGLGLPSAAAEIPGNFPMHPLEAEHRMQSEPFRVLSAKRTQHGVAGARKMKIRFEDGLELTVKWKSAPRYKPEGWNNVPRKEIAAYEIQKWFLDAPEFVVPPTVARCIPLADFRAVEPDAEPTADSGTCVFGAMSLWIGSVETVDRIVDRQRFREDDVYARSLGNVNILGYLIEHRDARKSNFLISTVPGDSRVFSIDNGISFGVRVFNIFAPNMSSLRVPELPRTSIDRLHRVSFDNVLRLGVLGEFERIDGHLVSVPPDPNMDPSRGSRVFEAAFQFGLSRSEISGVWRRLGKLLADVNDGRIGLR